jgi:hypothetical protein
MQKHTTYFVSGPLDISAQEFAENYGKKLELALEQDPDAHFVLGDAPGTDRMTFDFLLERTPNITVYHLGSKPRHDVGPIRTCGGFRNHDEADSNMTFHSDEDILWIRSEEQKRALYKEKYRPRKSGTQKNAERRLKMKI